MPALSALDLLSRTFELSQFERELLILCAGIELDSALASRCAALSGGSAHATLGLALSSLPGAHWNAIAPGRPLRRYRILEVGPGAGLLSSPLRIDERVLHYLTGIRCIDERLENLVERVEPGGDLVATHQLLVDRIAEGWMVSATRRMPPIELLGPDLDTKRAILAAVCARLGLRLYALPAHALGSDSDHLLLAHLLTREALLDGCALLVECDDLDIADAASAPAARRLIDRVSAPLFISRRERGPRLRRNSLAVEVRRPTPSEQVEIYRACLPDALDGGPWLERVVAQFDLGAPAIRAACAAALLAASDRASRGEALWDACRAEARTRLDDLAQRIESSVGWDDLVLPSRQLRMLNEIGIRVRQRTRVHETWGFGKKSDRGLGISALFSGPSGTGKTLAAEVLANQLRLDLYRVDLSQVVSKYIGETEKNLRRVFDAAEEGAAVLLFDEADALFGKRSEVKDSHDRYANVEISYLLQRVEAYRGLAILTTNMRGALDSAFVRRLAFVIEFPYPDQETRAQIWQRVFPPATPTAGLDVGRLAQLSLSGGNIRNVALAAAFLAAEAGESVQMHHIFRACEAEYAKLDRSLPPDVKPHLE